MRRSVGSLFILAMLFGSIDAAMDLERNAIAGGDSHEMHGGFHDSSVPDSDDPESKPDIHFCHCAAHAPAVASIHETPLLSGDNSVPEMLAPIYRNTRSPPLLPPPIV